MRAASSVSSRPPHTGRARLGPPPGGGRRRPPGAGAACVARAATVLWAPALALAACGSPEAGEPLVPSVEAPALAPGAPAAAAAAAEPAARTAPLVASEHGHYFVGAVFEDVAEVAPSPLPIKRARLAFYRDADGQSPAREVQVAETGVIMPCCHSRPGVRPAWRTAAEPHLGEVVDVRPSKTGRWELQVVAQVDGGPQDTWVGSFHAP